MAFIKEQNTASVWKTKFSAGGGVIVVLLGFAILALAERILYDAGRLLVPGPLDYFNNLGVIGIHAAIIIGLLLLALMASVSFGERRQKYAMALLPYYVVSIILMLQLTLQVLLYFSLHHTTFEFYLLMSAIVIASTFGMYYAQRRHVVDMSGAEGSGPSAPLVVAILVVFGLIFAGFYYSYASSQIADNYRTEMPSYAPVDQTPSPPRPSGGVMPHFVATSSVSDFSHTDSAAAGLVGRWLLTLPQMGDALVGMSGTGYNTTWEGIPYAAQNTFVQGFTYFNGQSEVRVRPTQALAFQQGSTISISAWIYPRSLTSLHTIVSKDKTAGMDTTVNYGFRVGQQGGQAHRLLFYYGAADGWHGYMSSENIISTGTWQHVTVTYTFGHPETAHLYYNGAPIAGSWVSGNGMTAPRVSNGELWIGNLDDGYGAQGFDGLIADVRIYNRAVSQNEITQIMYEATLPNGSFQ